MRASHKQRLARLVAPLDFAESEAVDRRSTLRLFAELSAYVRAAMLRAGIDPNSAASLCRLEAECADFAALEGRCQHAGASGGVVALLQQRQHPLAELGQLRGRAFAAEQIAAQFGLKLLDRPRQRRLGHVAIVGRAREVQQTRNREEIPDLVHFHDRAARLASGKLA